MWPLLALFTHNLVDLVSQTEQFEKPKPVMKVEIEHSKANPMKNVFFISQNTRNATKSNANKRTLYGPNSLHTHKTATG
jgi:hypothetical protein